MLENTAVALGTGVLLITIFASWSPANLRPTTDFGVGWEHIAAFGILGGCWGFAFPRRAFQLLLMLTLTAIVLEAGQFVVPGRHARLIDVATKIAGGAAGILMAYSIHKLTSNSRIHSLLYAFLSAGGIALQPKFLMSTPRNLGRDIRLKPLSAFPGRLVAIAHPKLIRLSEEVGHLTPFGNMIGRPYRGKGIAVMLHEVHRDVDAELRTGCNPAQLERIIGALRAAGRDIVTPDEGLRRLGAPDTKPFALITYDDAYRDNLTNALPVLERLNAPMTLFVPTGMITRELYAWWLGIRHWVIASDSVDIEPMGRRFICTDLARKVSTMRQITSWIGHDQARADSLSPFFKAQGIDMSLLVDRYAMNEDELRRMAAHPLVTIGGHTETHRFLAGLPEAEARQEFQGNKAWLEALLDRPISYFAYPFGTPGASGEREARLAAEAGFRASFTTRAGQLFAEHLEHPQLLPRIDVGYAPQSAAALASRLNGLTRAVSTRFGNPIAILN